MHKLCLTTFALAAAFVAPAALAQITFYEHDDFRGHALTTTSPMQNFREQKFNDRASSVLVERGRSEVCQDNDFGGNCVVLRPGRYASLGDMGLNDRISSIGGGSGRTLATAGGAVAGAAIGANTGRSNQTEMRDVNRCESVSSTVPTYWDISYRFRGIDHQTQMDSQPGRTVTVNANANANANGEPRL